MSSSVGREEVEQQIWQAGIRDLRTVNRLMRVIDAYVYHTARNLATDMIARAQPEVIISTRKRTYKCIGDCRQAKLLEEFPEKKRLNPSIPSPCSYCNDRRVTVQDAGRGVYHDEKTG